MSLTAVPKRLFQEKLTSGMTSVISGNSTKIIVKEIVLCNNSATPTDVEIVLIPNGVTYDENKHHIFNPIPLDKNETKVIQLSFVMEPLDALRMASTTENLVSAYGSGVEMEVIV